MRLKGKRRGNVRYLKKDYFDESCFDEREEKKTKIIVKQVVLFGSWRKVFQFSRIRFSRCIREFQSWNSKNFKQSIENNFLFVFREPENESEKV